MCKCLTVLRNLTEKALVSCFNYILYDYIILYNSRFWGDHTALLS